MPSRVSLSFCARAATVAWLVALAPLLWPAAAHAIAGMEDVRAAMRSIAASGRYQMELPAEVKPDDIRSATKDIEASGRHQMTLPDAEPARPEPPVIPPSSSHFWESIRDALNFSSEIVRFLFWAAIAAVAVFFLTPLIMRANWRFRRRPPLSSQQVLEAETREVLFNPGGDPVAQARALAAAGRASDAIHVLMLAAVYIIRREQPQAGAKFTNRELLKGLGRSGAVRDGFGFLVRAAELIRFGGRDPGPSDVERCCENYLTLKSGMAAHG